MCLALATNGGQAIESHMSHTVHLGIPACWLRLSVFSTATAAHYDGASLYKAWPAHSFGCAVRARFFFAGEVARLCDGRMPSRLKRDNTTQPKGALEGGRRSVRPSAPAQAGLGRGTRSLIYCNGIHYGVIFRYGYDC